MLLNFSVINNGIVDYTCNYYVNYFQNAYIHNSYIILGIYAMNKNNMMGIHCLPFCTLQHIINGINYICFVTYKVALTINIRHFIRYLFILDKNI